MADFVLYGGALSPFVRKTQAVLHHAGAEYDFEEINILAMPDWFLEISPARRIPVLRDRTIGAQGPAGTIPDSSSICLFLEKRFDLGLYADDAFDAGRVAWLEEYADTVLAVTGGMKLFRPILFPLLNGEPPDLETAKNTWTEKLPRLFDYFEAALDGRDYFVGDQFSLADIAVAAQMTQIDLVAGMPSESRWPHLVRHTKAMKERPGFVENLAICAKFLGGLLPSKINLDGSDSQTEADRA